MYLVSHFTAGVSAQSTPPVTPRFGKSSGYMQVCACMCVRVYVCVHVGVCVWCIICIHALDEQKSC